MGAIAGPETELVETAAKVAWGKYGLTVEVVTFSDYVTPNVALNDGSVDVNAFQHKPYLDAQIRDRGFKLVPVGNTFVYPIAGYSKKVKALSELKDGAQIAVPNDPTNLGRSLILLEKRGLLEAERGCRSGSDRTGHRQQPAQLQDRRAGSRTTAALPGRRGSGHHQQHLRRSDWSDPDRERPVCRRQGVPYVNLIVARENNKDDEKVKEFVQSFQTDEVFKKGTELFKGGLVKGW